MLRVLHLYVVQLTHACMRTVEPLNNGQIGSGPFVLYNIIIEVILFQKQRQTLPIYRIGRLSAPWRFVMY